MLNYLPNNNESIIARLIRAEQLALEKEEQAAREAANNSGTRSVNTSNMIGGAQSRDWYFYNPQLLRSGQQTFRSQWGNRTLEDNWRRLSKATTSSELAELDPSNTDSISNNTDTSTHTTTITDTHNPEYYLQQIPKTPAEIEQSNQLIANALYNMVYIYRDRVGDQELSDQTFQEFCRRFPQHQLLVDLYYMQYLTALKTNNTTQAEEYRLAIIQLFPNSNEAFIVSQPNYFDKLRRMSQEQDSLYALTYNAYCQSQFELVKTNKIYAETNYPLSPLMPRFMFLNAIATAKTEGQNAFITQLQDMVSKYPDNELAAMAKDMLALMGQGAESQTGDLSSLQARRAVETAQTTTQDSIQVQFSTDRDTKSFVLLLFDQDEQKTNQLLYEVALFNFSQFMIKDFDLKQIPAFTADDNAIQIAGFEKLDEAEWYYNRLTANPEIQQTIALNGVQVICITEQNANLIGTEFTLQDYLDWIK